MRPVFHPPGCLMNRVVFSAFIRSYSDANVRLPLIPIFASGCKLSSSTWYSSPIADPELFSDKVTKYFRPLFAPGDSLKSNDRSKALNFSRVTISPPLCDSAPPDDNTFITPSFISQPVEGKDSL